MNDFHNNAYTNREFVELYAKNLESNAYNAQYERPTTLSLLERIAFDGKKVLDLGCGPGLYLDYLKTRAGTVDALDQSQEMVRLAKERHPDCNVFSFDLSNAFTFSPAEQYGLVLGSLVFDYLESWELLFSEVARVLEPNGRLVFSISHPVATVPRDETPSDRSYFKVEALDQYWKTYHVSFRTYRRPLADIFSLAFRNGLKLESFVEARPTEACRALYPKEYEFLSKNPWFLVMQFTKDKRKKGP